MTKIHLDELPVSEALNRIFFSRTTYEGWNFNSSNYLFTTDTK